MSNQATAHLRPTSEFVHELMALINKHSQEQASNTPDFILAKYLACCLYAWNRCTDMREQWYGRAPKPVAEDPA